MIKDENQYTPGRIMAVMAAGLVGACAYGFSDSFWFSAEEAIVFASSAFFTALTFWAILKWENVADEKYADRWIILIAFLVGLAIEVHLLNLLTIPAMALFITSENMNFPGRVLLPHLSAQFLFLRFLCMGSDREWLQFLHDLTFSL